MSRTPSCHCIGYDKQTTPWAVPAGAALMSTRTRHTVGLPAPADRTAIPVDKEEERSGEGLGERVATAATEVACRQAGTGIGLVNDGGRGMPALSIYVAGATGRGGTCGHLDISRFGKPARPQTMNIKRPARENRRRAAADSDDRDV